MKTLPHIVLAEPVIHGVLKLAFDDGFEGVVDLRPLLAKGKIFAWLQTPAHLQTSGPMNTDTRCRGRTQQGTSSI